ncbi:MAG: right-handed parallel beta-helix repeat-containing protein, partial [Methanomassiliicoccales archaeon]
MAEMSNKSISIVIVGLMVIAGFFGFLTFESDVVTAAGATIYVDDDNTGFEDGSIDDPWNTITEGVNDATPQDTVFVFNGTYVENIWISEAINLIGEDKNETIIDGGNITDTVTIFADWVNITGFKITNGNPSGMYIQSFSEYNTVEDNIISDNYIYGVEIFGDSDHNTISENDILNNGDTGVEIQSESDYNIVSNNNIDNNSVIGVYINNPASFPNLYNNITNNYINNSQIGIYVKNSNNNNIIDSNFVNNTQYGISLDNFNGDNIIRGNTVYNSSFYNIFLWNSDNNEIYHNNFLDIYNPAYDNGVNLWNKSYPGGGNFWWNYSGGDNRSGPNQDIPGNDGFGDEHINIPGGTNADYYPLWPNWNALELYRPSPEETEVIEYAIGSVRVSVIFVESNGSIDSETEDWSPSRRSTAMSEITDALNWWESLEANSSLSFSIEDMGTKDTSYEAITRTHSDDALWIGEIMVNMGFTSGIFIQRVMDYNYWAREQYGTDWAYTIFVVDSYNDTDGYFADPPACAYAYLFAGCVVMTYDNGFLGINYMNNVTAHETGHMFYASDEYEDPGERRGYLNAL